MKKSLMSIICLMIAVVTAISFSACGGKKEKKIAYSEIGQSAVANIMQSNYLTIDINNLHFTMNGVTNKEGWIQGKLYLQKVSDGYNLVLDADLMSKEIMDEVNNEIYYSFNSILLKMVDGEMVQSQYTLDQEVSQEGIYQNDELVQTAITTLEEFINLDKSQLPSFGDYTNVGTLKDAINKIPSECGVVIDDAYTVITSLLNNLSSRMEGEVKVNDKGYNYTLNLNETEFVNSIVQMLSMNMDNTIGELLLYIDNVNSQTEFNAIIDEMFKPNFKISDISKGLDRITGKTNFLKNTVDTIQGLTGLSTQKLVGIANGLFTNLGVTEISLPTEIEAGKTFYDVLYNSMQVFNLDEVIRGIAELPAEVTTADFVKSMLFGDGALTVKTLLAQMLEMEVDSEEFNAIRSMLPNYVNEATQANFNFKFDGAKKLTNLNGAVSFKNYAKISTESSVTQQRLIDVACETNIGLSYDVSDKNIFAIDKKTYSQNDNLDDVVIDNISMSNISNATFVVLDNNGLEIDFVLNYTFNNVQYVLNFGAINYVKIYQSADNQIKVTLFDDGKNDFNSHSEYKTIKIIITTDDSRLLIVEFNKA